MDLYHRFLRLTGKRFRAIACTERVGAGLVPPMISILLSKKQRTDSGMTCISGRLSRMLGVVVNNVIGTHESDSVCKYAQYVCKYTQ